MVLHVDVAIIGAGSAGLAALEEVRKVTKAYVVVDDGPLGTLCARAGCMPSKALIQAASESFRCGGKSRRRIPEALARVRRLRDRFVGGAVRSTRLLGSRLLRGRAIFAGPRELRVGTLRILAKRVILATGSRPVLPEGYPGRGPRMVTTDDLFDLDDLPRRIGVLGLGPIGLEIGQALSRLGCDVIAFDRSRGVGGLSDPAVNSYAARHFSRQFPIRFGRAATAKDLAGRDLVLASLGRRPNLDRLGLETLGVALDARGVPGFDGGTMKVFGLPIYLAGDAGAKRLILHEALDDGRIAGYNSVRAKPRRFERRAPLAITFSEPNLALVGSRFDELTRGTFVTGEADLETQARALIMGEASGLLHVYAGVKDGRFLGAEMIGPSGEHLAHLMAWALQLKLTVFEMLRLPFYHPVVEEGLRTALLDAARKLGVRRAGGR